jgi:hypothetical protein
MRASPGGGIGIRGRLRACAFLGVLVRIQSGATKAGKLGIGFPVPCGLSEPSWQFVTQGFLKTGCQNRASPNLEALVTFLQAELAENRS